MRNLLLILAHPSPSRSRVNIPMYKAACGLEGVKTRDLYELYPDMHINVAAEQAALRQAHTVVFQFPIFWFSSPALLKEWQDTVLTSGFAYGKGNALKDKKFMVAVTSGGTSESYSADGRHGADITQYLAPFEQTARFCDMQVLNNFVVQDASTLDSKAVSQRAAQYVDRLRALMKDSR